MTPSALLIMLLTLLILAGAGFYLWRSRRNAIVRERLAFGFLETIVEEGEDLSAGDYGLTGSDRFYYHLQDYLNSRQGRTLLLSGGGAAGGLAGWLWGMPPKSFAITAAVCGLGALLLSMALISIRRTKREQKIRKELPNALELMAAIMEGGLAFEATLGHLLRESDSRHPLYFDLRVMNEAMQRGRRRIDALRLWAERCNLSQVQEVAFGLIQADQTGSSLGAAMRHHAMAQLRDNEAEIQRRAERLPIRMLLPMVSTILPAIIVIAAGPSFLKIIRVIEQIIGGAAMR